MKITEEGGFSCNHLYLHLALKEAADTYKKRKVAIEQHPPVTEDTGAELVKLYYALSQQEGVVILLAAACVEAAANLYLATKTTPEQFAALDGATFVEKWMVLPSLFLKDYTFPKGSNLEQDLKLLQVKRNGLLHMKAKVTKGGAVVHKGSFHKKAGDQNAFMERCPSLASRLLENVAKFDPEGALGIRFTLDFEWQNGPDDPRWI